MEVIVYTVFVTAALLIASELNGTGKPQVSAELAPVPAPEPVKVAAMAMPQPARLVIATASLEVDRLKALTPKQLRDECRANGIKWRNCYGKNKHMPTAEMRERLLALKK